MKTLRKISEAQIQRGVIDLLALTSKRIPMYFFRSAAGMVRTEQGRMFKTGKPGTPDITICFCTGIFVGFEIKSATSRQSELQKQAQREIEAAGGFYFIIRSMQDAEEAIKWVSSNCGVIRPKP